MEVIFFNFSITLQRGLVFALWITEKFDFFSFILDLDRISLTICNFRIIRIGRKW